MDKTEDDAAVPGGQGRESLPELVRPARVSHAAARGRIAVVTLYTPDMRECGEISAANKAAYCGRHGYDFIACDHSLDRGRPPPWSKIRLVQRHLREYDWVFWTDADSLLMNWDIRVERFAGGAFDLVVGSDHNGPNTGQFLIRNVPAAHDFLQRVYEQEQFIRHGWHEQAAVHHLLRTGQAGIRWTVLAHRSLNSYPESFQPGDFLIHMAGKIDKLALMRRFAALRDEAMPCGQPERWRAGPGTAPAGPVTIRAPLRIPRARGLER